MNQKIELRKIDVVRYVTPLREGGSMPGIVEGNDGFLYVLKFSGAGQGVRALIAEIIGAEIARRIGLRVPEIVFAHLDEGFGRTEPDEEIQDLLKFSVGLNLALHYLSGAITYDPVAHTADELTASKIVWLDCLLTNMDRTARNTNMLIWHKELWLIDHGASLYFHHAWQGWQEQATKPFLLVKDHVLLPKATQISEVDAQLSEMISDDFLREVLAVIPDEWLNDGNFSSPQQQRDAYLFFLSERIKHSQNFVNGANHARERLI